MRRIVMLRAKEGPRPVTRFGRVGLTAVLAAAALALSALRSPAQKGGEPNNPCRDVLVNVQGTNTGSLLFGVAANSDVGLSGSIVLNERNFDVPRPPTPPFDLSALPSDALGVVAIRPQALFGRPALKSLTRKVNDALGQVLKSNGLSPLGVEDIEQIVSTVIYWHDGGPKHDQKGVVLGISLIRSAKNYDWNKALKTLGPDAEEVKYAGTVYYRLPKSSASLIGMLGMRRCWHVRDARTVVFDDEEPMRRLLDRKPGEGPANAWAPGWKRIEGGLMAVALNTRDGDWANALSEDGEGGPELTALRRNTSWLTFGINGEDDFVFQLQAQGKDKEGAAKAARALEALLDRARERMAKAKTKEPLTDGEKLGQEFLEELLRRAKVTRDGDSVRLRCRAKVDFAGLVTAFVADEVHS
jgi:hypothetical protein